MKLLDQLFLDLQQALAGEYSLERELGRGGMGVVFLAREVQLDRLVAIKVLPRERAANDDTRARFLTEARTAAQLFHPNIVPIYRVGEAAGLPYFVMAYVDGETLGERLRRRGPLVASAVSAMLRDVGQALGYAHLRGVVHRDVKPDNILLERESGRALVSDFGIASRLDDEASNNALVGTAQFMSPEQMLGQQVDGRTDLYALGLVAHLALSGKLPFDATASTRALVQRVSTAPLSLAIAVPDLPPGLIRAVDTCLEQDVSKRWANAESLVNALEPDRTARAQLPAALREWARSRSWLTTMLPAYLVSPILSEIHLPFGWWLRTALPIALPVAAIVAVRLIKTRAVLASGHSLADLRLALRLRDSAGDDGGTTQVEGRGRRILRAITLTGLVLAALAAIGGGLWGYSLSGHLNTSLPVPWQMSRRSLLNVLYNIGSNASYVGAWGSVLLATFGAGILPPKIERRVFGRMRERFWTSRAGEWLVAKLTPEKRAVASTNFRPTEVAVAVAADELFAALPTAYRNSLSEVPAVVARLTTRAATLREGVDEMSKLMRQQGAAGEETLGESMSRSRADLAETVSALERIRLDLLRLHGGLADLRPITTTLNAAELIGADINRLRLAQREVGFNTPLPIDQRTPTPA